MKREKGSEAKHKAWWAYKKAERVFQETERACRNAERASQKAARKVQDAWRVYMESDQTLHIADAMADQWLSTDPPWPEAPQ